MRYLLKTELSDREIYFIGMIVTAWGFIENEIFTQTLGSYSESEIPPLPKALASNVQFTDVLSLWKTRVLDNASPRTQGALQRVYDRLSELHPHRAAIAHGRWTWDHEAPERITSTRFAKKRQISTVFDADSLQEMGFTLSEVRYDLAYPGGREDMSGAYMSRAFWANVTGHPVATELNGSLSRPQISDT
jgi:hypothetical protein